MAGKKKQDELDKGVSNGDTHLVDLVEFGFEGAPVRTVMQGDMPWFNANDVCKALGYQNAPQTLDDHVDPEDRNTISVRYRNSSKKGNPSQNFINESGLYALIFGSSKPKARRFKRWVTAEVLPQIRRSGQYQVEGAPVASKSASRKRSDDPFELTPEFFTRLYYAMDKRLGATALVWYLIEHGALDRELQRSARIIADEIGKAVKYSSISKFSHVLRDEGYLDYSTSRGARGSYRLFRKALEQALLTIPDDGDERPGLDMIVDMVQTYDLRKLH